MLSVHGMSAVAIHWWVGEESGGMVRGYELDGDGEAIVTMELEQPECVPFLEDLLDESAPAHMPSFLSLEKMGGLPPEVAVADPLARLAWSPSGRRDHSIN
jgi:hypothetical protein